MNNIDLILSQIEAKQKEINSLKFEIENVLVKQLNKECETVILSKFKLGVFVTHRNKYVFKLGGVCDCQIQTDAFITLDAKRVYNGKPFVNVCRAVTFIDNARLATDKEIQLYLDLHKKYEKGNI